MRILYSILTGLLPMGVIAQTKVIEQAIVQSKTEITFPQNANRPAGGDNDNFSEAPAGMESKNTVYLKGDLVKTFSQSDFGNNTVIIDKKNKTTTTLIEAMGRKTGYTVSDTEQEAVQKRMRERMDSVRQANGQPALPNDNTTPRSPSQITETSETKKIADYTCKKAIIKNTTRQGETLETVVWYTPDFKMAEGYPITGSAMGGRGFAGRARGNGGFINTADLEKINGFIMAYEISRPNGFSMKMEVTKIQLNPDITDKTFDVPKGYEMKSAQEVQNMFLPGGGRGGFSQNSNQ